MMKKPILLAIALILVMTAVTSVVIYAAYSARVDFKSTGTIKQPAHPSPSPSPDPNPIFGLTVLRSPSRTPVGQIENLQWGEIEVGKEYQQTIYVMNTGDIPLKISLFSSEWTIGVDGQISWNQQDAVIAPNTTTPAVVTLKILSAGASGQSVPSSFETKISVSGTSLT